MHEQEHKQFSTFQQWIQYFFALDIGLCHLKKKREKKSYPHRSIFEKKRFSVKPCKKSSDLCEKVFN